MSNIYIQEPPTNGKVLLNTSLGDIDVELWSKEAPKACRNFVQLCMEGYYDNTIFHRIVKGFCIQGGDPTGTGLGGESIYGHGFKDEFHQRLKFNRRGLVAMANSGANDNHSQFFFTLDRADELNGKHTIFAKVVGNTIYNMLKMVDCETDDNDRPLYPPKIKKTEILSNPFDDIVPRESGTKKAEKKEKKPKEKGTKNFSLLSFGEEAEEDEEEVSGIAKDVRMKSSHDLLNDPKLSRDTSPSEAGQSKQKEKKKLSAAKTEMELKEDNDSEEDESEEELVDKVRSKLKKPKLEEKIAEENHPETSTSQKRQISDTLDDFRKERKLFKKKSKEQISRGSREEQTLALLSGFQSTLLSLEESNQGEESDQSEDEDSKRSSSWLSHKLICEDSLTKVKDANIENEDTYEIFDPRNPINKRRREASKDKGKDRKRR